MATIALTLFGWCSGCSFRLEKKDFLVVLLLSLLRAVTSFSLLIAYQNIATGVASTMVNGTCNNLAIVRASKVFPVQLPVCCFIPVSALKIVLLPTLGEGTSMTGLPNRQNSEIEPAPA